jgi:2-succinyl-6-hydroxy-2,4-cyclohexadiene-1-carboxylate synthase
VLQPVVLLHGFGGTHRAWDGVMGHLNAERYRALALDLPGHGANATSTRPITFQACVDQVLAQAPQDEPFVLCGYSMGGRIALHVALTAPERLSALVLVSSSPGIEDAEQREARRTADEQLAVQLETAPHEDFIERWRAQPLFAEDPPQVQHLAKADQRRNDPNALAAALRALGAGAMQPLWQRLPTIDIPTVVIVGERDTKYVAIGERMTSLLPNASLKRLQGGHVLLLENPAAVSEAIEASSRGPRAVTV